MILFVFALYLVFIIWLGIKTSAGGNATKFFIAGQNQPYWVIGSGYVASFLSTASFMGTSGLVYHEGFVGNGAYMGSTIGYIAGLALFGPLMRRFGQFTIPDFLGERYDSNATRGISAVILFIGFFLYIGSQVIGVSVLFQLLFDIPIWLGIVISISIVAFYTIAGGMMANAIIDAVQFIITWVTAIIVLILGVIKTNGVFSLVSQVEKYYPNFLTPDNGTGDTWAIWSVMLIWIIGSLARADLISRAYLAKSEREVYKAILFVTPVIWVCGTFFFLYGMIGTIVIPGLEGKDSELIYLLMAQDWLLPVIAGLAFAGFLASAQSTASTQLMVSSAAIGRDLYGKIIGPKLKKREITNEEMMKVTRWAMLVMCIAACILALNNASWILDIINISMAVMGPAFLVTWLGGFFWKRAAKTGAVAALIVGSCSAVYTFVTDFEVAGAPWLVPPLFSLILTAIAFIIGSLFGKPSKKSLEVFSRLNPRYNYNAEKDTLEKQST